MPDGLSRMYASLVNGTYDGVVRIVLNAYFRFAQSPRSVDKLERPKDKERMMVRSMKKTQVARLLAYLTGMVNQQLLLQK